MDDIQLSPHFKLTEFTNSYTATRFGIDNTPSDTVLVNLHNLAAALEEVRILLGNNPIRISSGYRTPKLNAQVGGSKTSAHMRGLAGDFTCDGYGNPLVICKKIANSKLNYHQLINEGTWVHLAISPAGVEPRRENLRAIFNNGRVYYQRDFA